uniref:Translocon-associated protein subunit delta n=1 Tax=Amazona collaria TaxID=241587 RepID=A0A8B9IXC5_9PSIT
MEGLHGVPGVPVPVLSPVLPAAAEPCPEPTIVPSYYTTSDAVISSESVFVVEISLACKNGAQVSWSLEHRSAQSGTYEVKFFDEESYSALRKAQRNNEDVSRIRPLFTVNVDHRVKWGGAPVGLGGVHVDMGSPWVFGLKLG